MKAVRNQLCSQVKTRREMNSQPSSQPPVNHLVEIVSQLEWTAILVVYKENNINNNNLQSSKGSF